MAAIQTDRLWKSLYGKLLYLMSYFHDIWLELLPKAVMQSNFFTKHVEIYELSC